MKSPREVIHDSTGLTLDAADVLIRALYRNGYIFARGERYPYVVEHVVCNAGDAVVMPTPVERGVF